MLLANSMCQKCDGVKPVCGPCRKHPKDDECEYNDGPGRSRTRVLEDTVSRLEARLHELEHPNESTPAVTLHDPYSSYHESQSPPKPAPALVIPESHPQSTMSPFSPSSTTSSLSSGRHWTNFAALESTTESTGSSGSSKSPIRQYTGSPFLGAEVGHSDFLCQHVLIGHSCAGAAFFNNSEPVSSSCTPRFPYSRASQVLINSCRILSNSVFSSTLTASANRLFFPFPSVTTRGPHPHS